MSKVERALRAQKQKLWQELTTSPRSVVEQLRGSLRHKFKNRRPFLVIGNGPVTRSGKKKVARLQREEHAVVVTINDHRAQSAFKRIRPDIVAVNEYTRRRCRVLSLAAADCASVVVLVRDPRSRWRETLWQPLAPLHCARLRDHVLKRAQQVASVTSGFMMLAILHLLWPTRQKYLVGFGGRGHAPGAAPQARMYEGLVTEHKVLADVLASTPAICNLGAPLGNHRQPLAPGIACPRCPLKAAAGAYVSAGKRQFLCKLCNRRWTPARAPPRVPTCPHCQSRDLVVRNGNCFKCGGCGHAFRPALGAQFRLGPYAPLLR